MTSRSFSTSSGSRTGFISISSNTAKAVRKWGRATLHQKTVTSRSVLAFIIPPTPSMASLTSRAVGHFSLPLKGRCSMKWETPASSGDSYREPAPTKKAMETDWVWRHHRRYDAQAVAED